jgi:hypothetical protein
MRNKTVPVYLEVQKEIYPEELRRIAKNTSGESTGYELA